MIILVQGVEIDQIRPVDIEESTESKTVIPAGRKVANFYPLVASGLSLTPQQKTLLSGHALRVDVADSESQDERPYQTQNNLAIAIDDILRSNIRHLDPPPSDEVKTFVDILELLHAKLWFGSITAEGFSAEDFEQVDEDNLRELTDQCLQSQNNRLSGRWRRLTPSERSVTRSSITMPRTLILSLSLREQETVSQSRLDAEIERGKVDRSRSSRNYAASEGQHRLNQTITKDQ
jgi:hypothetical protein